MTRFMTPGPAVATDQATGSVDHITLTGLRVRGRHGVLPAERELGQEFVVDAVIWLDMSPAAHGDDVTLTVHYGELAETLAGIVGGEPVDLIETLAYRLADACLAHDRVTRARVTVHKPAAPIPLAFTDVAVTVTRDRPADPAVEAGARR
ncbi:dihydroneopterin aldolase [Frankia sp. AgB32]|uniref:dihydroneopterin aldolase n=1 Tax=Frankia sp. AgB32 TaxID=631119 RepID=UPI00200FF45D|nr:dihydroneopterin aldolase [Frankia sp. AgB32]MCK9897069.1 dihydroneopterin aldolase [Frankia sp. AgB32]